MGALTPRDSGPPLRAGRRVAVRFSRNDPRAIAALLDLLNVVQISASARNSQESIAYGWWAEPIDELDRRLRQIGVTGLALVGVVEGEIVDSLPETTVQSWRVAVRLEVRNSPLFVYLTSLLASIKVTPEPYSHWLWIEGTFTGSLEDLKVALRQLQADEFRILHGSEVTTAAVASPVMTPATVIEEHEPALALPTPAGSEAPRSTGARAVRRDRKSPHWLPTLVVVSLLVVAVLIFMEFRAERLRWLASTTPSTPAPPLVDPRTVPWAYMVEQTKASSWLSLQRKNGWSNEEMQALLPRLGDYVREPALIERSFALLRSQGVRTPAEYRAFVQLLRTLDATGWPFPDEPQDQARSIGGENYSLLRLYQGLSEREDVLIFILNLIGNR